MLRRDQFERDPIELDGERGAGEHPPDHPAGCVGDRDARSPSDLHQRSKGLIATRGGTGSYLYFALAFYIGSPNYDAQSTKTQVTSLAEGWYGFDNIQRIVVRPKASTTANNVKISLDA